MGHFRRVHVYAGSSDRIRPEYKAAAEEPGPLLDRLAVYLPPERPARRETKPTEENR